MVKYPGRYNSIIMYCQTNKKTKQKMNQKRAKTLGLLQVYLFLNYSQILSQECLILLHVLSFIWNVIESSFFSFFWCQEVHAYCKTLMMINSQFSTICQGLSIFNKSVIFICAYSSESQNLHMMISLSW